MYYSDKYLKDLLVRLAHHSSAIEGNTISLPETVSIIIENQLPTSRKSIKEFYEIENHKKAFEYILEKLENKDQLTEQVIKEIHKKLVDRLQHDAGRFKVTQNAIIGAEFQTASPEEVPYLIKQWIDNTEYRIELANEQLEKIKVLAESHIQFERIHPFSDGNGRTGRMILLMESIKHLGVPVLIRKEERAEYIESLANQDENRLAKILKSSLDNESERMKQLI